MKHAEFCGDRSMRRARQKDQERRKVSSPVNNIQTRTAPIGRAPLKIVSKGHFKSHLDSTFAVRNDCPWGKTYNFLVRLFMPSLRYGYARPVAPNFVATSGHRCEHRTPT